MKLIALTLIIAALASGAALAAGDAMPMFPQVEIETNQGSFVVELDTARAPISVANFLRYVQEGYYDGTVFHRVIPGFVAQAGGFDKELKEKKTRDSIPNESGNGLSNTRGTIAMARMGPPHTANAQFYINLGENRNLDPSPSRWGYCVFGEVIDGMETLDKIAAIPTGGKRPFARDFPQMQVIIVSARLVEDKPVPAE